MFKTIQLWWSGSWLVHILEKLAFYFAATARSSWLGRGLAKPWQDAAPAFITSRSQSCLRAIGTLRSRGANRLQPLLATSLLLRQGVDRGDGDSDPARSLLSVLAVLLAGIVALVALRFSFGETLIRWGVLVVALALAWAQPRSAIYAVAFLLPILPILSIAMLIAVAFVARLCQEEPLLPCNSWVRTLGGLFCLVGLAAALASEDTLAALRYWRYYLAGFLLLVLLLDGLRTRQELGRLLHWGLLGAAVVSLLSIWQYFGGMPTNLSWVDIRVAAVTTRVVGTFDNPNMLAGYLVAWLPFPVCRFLAKEASWRQRLTGLMLAGLLGIALLLTFSRGGWLAFAAALFMIVVYQQPRLLWVVPLLLLAAPFVLPPVIWQRLASIINLEDTSNMVRLYVWESSAQMFFANWWLGIGQGLAPFARVYPIYQYGVVPALHAHSLILQLAVESGVLALCGFLWLATALWRLAMQRWQLASVWTVPLGAALVGHLVHGIFDHAWYDLRVMLLFWLLLAVAAAIGHQRWGESV